MTGLSSLHAADWSTLLCFHRVGGPHADDAADEAEYSVGTEMMLRVLDVVAERDDVSVSFDDGFISDVEVALPALLERGLSARFFPVGGRVGAAGFLGEGDLRTLHEAGMSLGVHGWTHDLWTDVERRGDLVCELERSRDLLHAVTGAPVTEAACPLGAYNRRVMAVLRRQGFVAVYTSDRAHARPGNWLLPRFSVRVQDSVDDIVALLDERSAWGRAVDQARITGKRLR